MGEAIAVKRVEESAMPTKYGSLFDEMQDIFNAISRRAYEMGEILSIGSKQSGNYFISCP